ncbi:MAG: hypothetical protein HYX54_01350 [Chloroflexi bacterium]|nr:hypothetical protein [Chloroflexota bacterium]
MQIIGSGTSTLGRVDAWMIARTLVVGAVFLICATLLAYAVFGTGILEAFTPNGRATSTQLAIGALAWTFGLTAPAAFGVLGIARVGAVIDQLVGRRKRPTPAYRARNSLGPDHALARRVPLPDGSRIIPEIVIGPFGAAVIEELPPAGAVVSRGPRSWEVRVANGRTHLIDHPLERAARDAERVRLWFGGDDIDHVVKVYAAVVGTDSRVERTSSCASITPDQVGPWLGSLPAQRSFDDDRRERIIRMVRSAV